MMKKKKKKKKYICHASMIITSIINDKLIKVSEPCNTGQCYLMLIMQVKHFGDNIMKYFFLFFPENQLLHFMQIVFLENNLYEMSKLIC